MKSSSKKRNILFALLLIVLFLIIYHFWVKDDMSDFDVCYKGGQRILKGETLYQELDGHLMFKYLPLSALFFSVFTFLPYEIAKVFWYFFELFLLFLTLHLSYKILPTQQRKKGFVIFLTFLAMLKFISREIELGQVNLFMLFLLVIMLKAVIHNNDVKGGLFWGFSLFFKPYALVFLPYFLLKKRIKLVVAGIGIFIVGLVLPAVFYGFKGNIAIFKQWLQTLSKSTPSLLAVYDNASLYAFFLSHLPDDKGQIVLILIGCSFFIIGCVFLGMMFLGSKRGLQKTEFLECSFLFILIPIFSPLAWYYNYLYSLPAILFLIHNAAQFPKILRYILIADIVIIGASLVEVLGKETFRFYNEHSLVVLNYLIILFYLFYARLKSYS